MQSKNKGDFLFALTDLSPFSFVNHLMRGALNYFPWTSHSSQLSSKSVFGSYLSPLLSVPILVTI